MTDNMLSKRTLGSDQLKNLQSPVGQTMEVAGNSRRVVGCSVSLSSGNLSMDNCIHRAIINFIETGVFIYLFNLHALHIFYIS